MGFQIMGTKHLGVDQPIVENPALTLMGCHYCRVNNACAGDQSLTPEHCRFFTELVWPYATPIFDKLCRQFGNPSGHDYQAYLRPWDEI